MVNALDSGSSILGSRPGLGTALCSWARHFTLIVPPFTQVYKWHGYWHGIYFWRKPVFDSPGYASSLMGHLACIQTFCAFPLFATYVRKRHYNGFNCE